jgi:hypothetical protein
MPKTLTLTAAFATSFAELVNARWAFSSIALDRSLVISCWNHYLKKFTDGHQRYEDRLSRWTANIPGKQLLIELAPANFSLPRRVSQELLMAHQAVDSGNSLLL